jgi:hypothetical protein
MEKRYNGSIRVAVNYCRDESWYVGQFVSVYSINYLLSDYCLYSGYALVYGYKKPQAGRAFCPGSFYQFLGAFQCHWGTGG